VRAEISASAEPTADVPITETPVADLVETELELASDEEFEQLTAELTAEFKAGDAPAEDAARIH
jgi:hypothetical protein